MNSNERPEWFLLVYQPYVNSPIRRPLEHRKIYEYKLNDLPPDDLLGLMNMAVELNDKEWFDQLSEQYNKTIINKDNVNT